MDYSNRIASLGKYLALDPQNPELLSELAECYHQTGQHELALQHYEKARAQLGESPALLNKLASVYLALGRWADATSVLRLAVAKDSAPALLFNLGYAELADGQSAKAAEHLREAVRHDPANPRFNYYFAASCYQENQPNQAREAIEKSLALEPKNADALLLAAHLDFEEGKLDVAQKRIEETVRLKPTSVDALWLQGLVALTNLESDKALKILQQAHSLKPADPDIAVSLGQAYLMLGRARQAKDVLLPVVNGAAGTPSALFSLGWAHLLLNEIESAERAFQSQLKQDPTDANAHASLALVRIAQQRVSEAVPLLNMALSLDSECFLAKWLQMSQSAKDRPKEEVEASLKRLMEEYHLTPMGFTPRDIMQKLDRSASGQRLIQKYVRYAKRKMPMQTNRVS